jgi:hypothetical protein
VKNPLLASLIGQTIARIAVIDADRGVEIHLSDGSVLYLSERMQAGQLSGAVTTPQGWADIEFPCDEPPEVYK